MRLRNVIPHFAIILFFLILLDFNLTLLHFLGVAMLSLPHLCIITAIIVLFNCFGLFGNLNVIIAVFRAPTLRTKAGYLMAILCILQSVCLICELANLRLYWREDVLYITVVVRTRTIMQHSFCFCMMSVYVFATIAQSLMYFMIVLDMLIAVTRPLKHRVWSTPLYVLLMCTPPMLIAATALIGSYIYRINNAGAKVSRAPTVAHDVMSTVTILLMVTNTAAIVVVLILLGFVLRNDQNLRASRHRRSVASTTSFSVNKTVRVVCGLVAVFVCTWYFSVASVVLALHLDLPEHYVDLFVTIIMIPALIAYSQNFYGLRKSPRYAPILQQQIVWLKTCGSKTGGDDFPATETTLKNTSVGNATIDGIPAAQTRVKSSSLRLATVATSNTSV